MSTQHPHGEMTDNDSTETIEEQSVASDNGRTAGDTMLSNIRADHNKEEAKNEADVAARQLKNMLNPERVVGDLISMDYGTAEVLIHDNARQKIGGVPHGCLLLATRIRPDDESLDLDDPQTSLILLRALKSSPLPNDVEMKYARLEAGQRAADTSDHWDEPGRTDQFTLHQMRFAGAHCRILGTFRMTLRMNLNPETNKESSKWQLEYGGDIDNFYAGQGMKVYKPAGLTLERIVNYTQQEEPKAERVEIGRLRYAASIRNNETVESVPIRMTTVDLLAQRTALFGMTRTGKSNTTKTIAYAIFRLRVSDNGQRVGQLIFDPNGEYANENSQDQGCLKNIANIRDDLSADVVTYGLQPHPDDPNRNITKFNFFGDTMPRGRNPSKEDLDEALQSLYQGKLIIDQALGEESGQYIQSFVNADITAPSDVDDFGIATRYRRALFVYKSVLVAAGFDKPSPNINIKGLFGEDIRKTMLKSEDMKSYAEYMNKNDSMPWDTAHNFCREFSSWVKSTEFKNFNRDYREDRNWSDDRFLGLLRIFENTRGLSIIQRTRQWHGLDSATDYADDIINHIRAGRLVIFDQALGDPEMNKKAAARIMTGIFNAQQQAFVNPETDDETGKFREPPPVIIYVEEAHTLLPKGSEDDATNIWARVAKEGAKFNIGMVYSTQEPSTIQTNILKNTENWFIAHLNNSDETRQLDKYNDFSDFTDSIIKVNETGFLRVRTLSSPYTLPVQIAKFEAPPDALPE